jgi:hypothetical protein
MNRTPLTNPLPIPAALTPATGLTPLRGPIPLPGTPGSPTPGRLPAGLAAIPRLRMTRLERLLAPLQQAEPTPRPIPAEVLNLRTFQVMLKRAQGSGELPKGQVAARNPLFRSATLFTRRRDSLHPCPATEPLKPPSSYRALAPLVPQNWLPSSPSPTVGDVPPPLLRGSYGSALLRGPLRGASPQHPVQRRIDAGW